MYIIKESIFRKVELPDIIYKYRSFADEKERRMLTNNEVYLANPDEFIKKGSKDCDFDVQYKEYSDEELFKFYSKTKTAEDAKKWASESPYKDKLKRHALEQPLRKGINECFGIFCASSTWNDETLWGSPFGDHGKGFCVGFKTEKFIPHVGFNGGGNLFYYKKDNEKPILTADPLNDVELYSKEEVHNFIMSLPNDFAEEKEYRLYKESQVTIPLQKKHFIPSDIIEEVIFGELFEIEDNTEIIQQLKRKGINVYQARYDFMQKGLIKLAL